MRRIALWVILSGCIAWGRNAPGLWTVAKTAHFQVYSQTSDGTAQQALRWFEQLRSFFQQNGLPTGGLNKWDETPLRIVGFRSVSDYEEYRIRPLADAYYASDGNHSYIVTATLQPDSFGVAAHEYAHYVLHASGLKLPTCLHEGLAEFFSTLRIQEGAYRLGGDLPARTQTLEKNKRKWFPLADLFNANPYSPLVTERKSAELFYAESWALADMLMCSPPYASHFRQLLTEINSGAAPAKAFRNVYSKTLAEASKDLEAWIGHTHAPHSTIIRSAEFDEGQTSQLSNYESDSFLAQLLLVTNHLEQAKLRYLDLLRKEPGDPTIPAALGTIAERQGKQDEALKLWKRAIDNAVQDSELCFRYALAADKAGTDPQGIRTALERAVALAPDFDDARYKLALVEYQAGDFNSAVEHLRAMRPPTEARRYGYWIALASALLELDKKDEARKAAQEAAKAAENETDKASARRLALIAATDLKVQMTTDSEGHSRLVTTRVAHGSADWNPFIEPTDQIERASGKLSEVLCSGGKLTGFLLRTQNGALTLKVIDPSRVSMRNSPSEFYCGPIATQAVEAEYAVITTSGKTSNVLRGMTFQR